MLEERVTDKIPNPDSEQADRLTINDLLTELPMIQEGWVRATHFTDKKSAGNILDSDFNYEPGFLSSKTDAYSSMEQAREVMESGRTGAFTRSSFGDCVVLIDLEASEHKQRLRIGSIDSSIPNSNVVGYVQIFEDEGVRRYKFFRNEKYSPIISDISFVEPTILARKTTVQEERPVINDADADSSDDLW